jgi:thiosulfate/3-mercaptopyruvate sulfurtransferase
MKGENMSNFVTPKWLYEHLKNNDLVIADCRADLFDKDYGRRVYDEGHIEGAQFIEVKSDLAGEIKEHGGRSPMPPLKVFKEKFEAIGIDKSKTVVAYDEAELAGAERFWWMLKYIGHDKVYVLNGGIRAWQREAYPLTTKVRKNRIGKIELRLDKSLITDISEVKDNMSKEGFIIVDSRAKERYKGDIEPIDKKAGHIPGAVNYHWKDVLKENGEFRSKEELEVHFRMLKGYKNITLQCGSGIDACGNFIAMSEINMKPKLYVGSWSDWVSYDNNPIAVGDKP